MKKALFMLLIGSLASVCACASSRSSQRNEPELDKIVAHRDVEAIPQEIPSPVLASAPAAPSANASLASAAAPLGTGTASANAIREREHTATVPTAAPNASVTESDHEITERVRKSLLEDKPLSYAAKNVQIMTNNGKVTLRGVVANEQERQAIEDNTTRVVGGERVDNQLQVRD